MGWQAVAELTFTGSGRRDMILNALSKRHRTAIMVFLCPSYETRLPHIFRGCIMFGHEVLAVIRRPEPERFCFH